MPRTRAPKPSSRRSPIKRSKKKTAKTFEKNPCYAAAMLKTSFDLRSAESTETNLEFEHIIDGIIDGLNIEKDSFNQYLDEYRTDLRRSCKKKGYI